MALLRPARRAIRLPTARDWLLVVVVCAAFFVGASQQRRHAFPFKDASSGPAAPGPDAIRARAASETEAAASRSSDLAATAFESARALNGRLIEPNSAVAYMYDDLDYAVNLDSAYCPALTSNREFFDRLPARNTECIRIYYRDQQFDTFAVLLRAAAPRGKLLVYNHGHGGLPAADDDYAFDLLRTLLHDGTDVLLTSMPFVGLNRSADRAAVLTYDGPSQLDLQHFSEHKLFEVLDPGRSSYLRFFVDSAVLPLAQIAPRYHEINYLGLSGGATTGLAACALLQRVLSNCMLVAGVMPLDIRLRFPDKSFGDAEQFSASVNARAPVRRLIDELARSQVQLHLIYNDRDPCCFDGPAAQALKNSLSAGRVEVTIRDSDRHAYDPEAILKILSPGTGRPAVAPRTS